MINPALCFITAGWLALCSAGATDNPIPLTLKQAQDFVLSKHPRVTAAELIALAARQEVNEAQSAYFPLVAGNIAAVGVNGSNVRMVSTSLPVSAVVDRGGASVTINQIITDFGRTANLAASARLKEKSEEQNVQATRAAILLEVDSAYFGALRAESFRHVAESTVAARRSVRDQVAALEKNQLRSTLDLSFAEVDLQQAMLLLSKADSDLDASYATLAALLDQPNVASYNLADEPTPADAIAALPDLIGTALRDRPDLLALQLDCGVAVKFASAEQALNYPTISAQAAAGDLPYHDSSTNHNYAAAGVVVSLPVFNGNLYSSRQKEAALRAQADSALLHDATNNVVRDVRIAWSSLNNAFRNLSITAELSKQATRSLGLAKARYDACTSDIVELSQAQLSLTSAQIAEADAKYEYLLRRAVLNFQTGTLK